MKYLVLYPTDDKDIRKCMDYWLTSAGGSLSWEEVKQNLLYRFNFIPKQIYNRAQVEEMGLLEKAYKLENGIVSFF